MGHRVKYLKRETASKTTAPVKNRSYLEHFICQLPSIISGKRPVDPMHLSRAERVYGHMGRGKGRKASDRWTLPGTRDEHTEQTNCGDELTFWFGHGIDPYVACLVLSGLWSDLGTDAIPYAERLILEGRLGRTLGKFSTTHQPNRQEP